MNKTVVCLPLALFVGAITTRGLQLGGRRRFAASREGRRPHKPLLSYAFPLSSVRINAAFDAVRLLGERRWG